MISTIEPCSMCFLIMEHEGAEYMGILKFGDSFVSAGRFMMCYEQMFAATAASVDE
jgi:hypothetical protein